MIALILEKPVSKTFAAAMTFGKYALDFPDEFRRVLPRQRGAAEIGRAPVHFHSPRLRHAANVSQRHRLTELHLSFATELAQQIGEMERTAGVAGIEQDSLAVDQIIGQALRQIFMADRRRRDDDQVDALHYRRQMRAHEIWRGLLATPPSTSSISPSLANFAIVLSERANSRT